MVELSNIQFFELKRSRYTGQYKRVSLKDIYKIKFLKQQAIENKIKTIKQRAQSIDKKLETAPNSQTVFLEKVNQIKQRAEIINKKLTHP